MNRWSTNPYRFTVPAWKLLWYCLRHPTYDIILHARTCLPPSPWTECFDIEVDNAHRVIRLSGDFD